MTTVACVFVRGHVPFTAEYVERLAAMVNRWIDRPYQFVCFTDHPEHVTGRVTRILVPTPTEKGWWSKLHIFRRDMGLSGRILYLDLDSLIVGSLDEIIDYPAPFALAPHAGTFNGKGGLAVVKRFNSSVMVFDYGANHRLYDDWTPSVAKRLHGDQDWVGEQMPEASAMNLEWFPRISELTMSGSLVIPASAKVVLVKKPKCDVAAQRWPNFREAWA
jgi:hypothetical protein